VKKRLLAFAVCSLASFGIAHSMEPATASDQGFVTQASSAGLSEIALGKMADARSGNVSIKQFGAMMVRDHGAANTELATIAESKGFTIPDSVSAEQDQRESSFESLLPAEFDRKYLDAMVSDHLQAIALFQQQSDAGADPELRAFAARTLPTLQNHLQTAKTLQASTGVNGNP